MLFNRETGEIIAPNTGSSINPLLSEGFIPLPEDLIERVNLVYFGVRRITLKPGSKLLDALMLATAPQSKKAPRHRKGEK